ncbi:MAG: DUF3488 and DUF4129 domain-containing transglutaminase family protein [Rhodospirillales bacterium]
MTRSSGGAAASVDRFFELSLLGLVASGYFAVLGSSFLDVPTAASMAAALLLRTLLVTGVIRFELPGRWVNAAALAYSGFYPLDYYFVSKSFLTATVHLIFFLAVVKILAARLARDYAFLAVIAFLELLVASLFSSSLNFFLFLALFLLFAVATFAASEVRRSIRKPHLVARGGPKSLHWRLAATSVSLAVGILILTVGLFFLLPRTAQAAFRHLAPQRFSIAGFSNEMVLGEVGELQKRRTAVMHVRFFDEDRPANLKWRGVALSQFDGRRWYSPPDPGEPLRVVDGLLAVGERTQGTAIRYEVQLSSMASDTLFFAGTPLMLRINSPIVFRTATDGYRLGYGSPGLHYGAYSTLGLASWPRFLREDQRTLYLLLPPLDRRIVALARRITEGLPTAEARARAIESYLQRSFRYTTDPLPREVADPLAHFLFERRAGYCEYFASAMAVMLRVVYIPSRVATGFQSGEYNPVSGWVVIRASDAHSWVEAWLPGRGWTTFDPTPPDSSPSTTSVWTNLGFYLDAAETFWQDWVLDYNLDRQLTLAARMENSGRLFGAHWMDRLRLLEWKRTAADWGRRYGVFAALAAILAFAIWKYGPGVWMWSQTRARVRRAQRGAARASDATLIYARLLTLLKRKGYQKPAWITPLEFARLLPPSQTATLVANFTAAYNDLRFGGDTAAASRMIEALESLERL